MEEAILSSIDEKKLLEEFILNNKELESLEAIVDKFNIFLSLDIINKEVRHSNFLGWLLDPSETHNLSDYFTTLFLKQVIASSNIEKPEIDIISVDTLDFSELQVLREWNNIDILLLDDKNKFLCVIENKVDSKEHSNQLSRYKKTVESNYPDYRKLFVYLTIGGENPENEELYIPFSYIDVSKLIANLIDSKSTQLNEEVVMFIKHYNDMIKRYIMEESDVQELCELLYKKHKKALDLIFKHKPDVYSDVREALEEIIDENETLTKDHCSKSYIRFIPKQLDFFPLEGEGWTPTKRILLFEAQNYANALSLFLLIGPGNQEIRQTLYNHVKNNPIFNKTWSQLPQKWASTYKVEISKIKSLEGKNKLEIKEILKDKLDKFFQTDFPQLQNAILELEKNYKK